MTEIVPLDVRRLRWGGVEAPAVAYLATVAAGSRASLVSALRTAAAAWGVVDASGRGRPELVPWSSLRRADVLALRARLEGSAPATAGRVLAAVRGVLRECYRAGIIDRATLDQLTDVRPVAGSRVPPGRHVDRAELRALLEDAARDESPAGRRDLVILSLLYGAGLRRAELAGLRVEDTAGASLRIVGKGRRERIAWLPPSCATVLAGWLAVRGTEPGPLVCAITRDRLQPARSVGAQTIYLAILARARRAGVRPLRPHDLRRTYIGDLLDAGVDLATVQAAVGHASPATTSRYDRRGERAARDAAARLSLPLGVQDSDADPGSGRSADPPSPGSPSR